jgi:PEP-CTERM motif
MRYQLSLSLLLLGASALQASQFTFSFSGGNVSATGSLTANNINPGSGPGLYDVTSITGTFTISGTSYSISQSPLGNLGALLIDQTGANGSVQLGAGGITFGVGKNGVDAVAYTGSSYTSVLTNFSTGSITSGTNFTVVDPPAPKGVPEPSTVLIFLTLGIVFWAFGRKLPRRALPK